MSGPAQVPGPTVAPSAWASVRLIQGTSKANQWQIDSSTTRAQLTVGADKSSDWPVAAERVAPIHFELFWDGRRLWIADTHEAGGVTVDGTRLATWQPITGRARIEFGTAVMVAECSLPAVSVERPAMSNGLEAIGAPHDPSDDERTRLVVRDGPGPGGGKADSKVPLHAAPTTISEMPEGVTPYGGPPAMPPGSGMSPPARLHPMKPSTAMPTIILNGGATPDPGRLPPGMLVQPNMQGQPGHGPGGGHGPGQGHGHGHGMMMARPGMGMATPDPGMGMRPGMGMPTPDPGGRPMMRPGMPPGPTPQGTRPPLMTRLGLPQTSIPPRTWGLVILTVAALMFVMFMGGDDETPKRRVAAKGKTAAADTQAGETKSDETKSDETKPDETKPDETKPDETKPDETKPDETKPAGATSGAPDGKTPDGKTPEGKTPESRQPDAKQPESKQPSSKQPETKQPDAKQPEGKQPAASDEPSDGAAAATAVQGADLLLAGRQREALAVYDELARRYPEKRVNAAIVKILKRRLAERCKDKQPGESPCPPDR